MEEPRKRWCVYIVRCSDNSLYTGITNNLERRIHNHNEGTAGCKYTRSRRPVKLVWTDFTPNSHEEALRVEARIKSYSKAKKEKIIATSSAGTEV